MEPEQPAYYYSKDEGWVSITEGYHILKETLKRRQQENKDYEHHPNVHAFYEYFKSFQMKGNESKLSDTRKELKKVTEGFRRVPERDTIQIWNLVPKDEDEAKSFVKDLERCPDSPIRKIVDLLNE